MAGEHSLSQRTSAVLFFFAKCYSSPDKPRPVKAEHILPALLLVDPKLFQVLPVTDSDEVIMAGNRLSVLRALPSSPKPRRRPFGFIRRAFHRLIGLFAILLISGWAIPAQLIELSRTNQRAPIDSSRRAKPVTYLALGDSTGLGLGAQNGYGYVEQLMTRIETEHPGSRLIKLCRLGETTNSLNQKLTERFSVKPTFVTLSIGMNDLFQRISEQEFGGNYEEIVKRLRRLAVPIVITNLPDISFAPRLPNSMRGEIHLKVLLFNKRIEALAKSYGLFFVDLYAASTGTLTKHQEFFASDGFHPSDTAYEVWTRTMWPTVKNAIGDRRTALLSSPDVLGCKRVKNPKPASSMKTIWAPRRRAFF